MKANRGVHQYLVLIGTNTGTASFGGFWPRYAWWCEARTSPPLPVCFRDGCQGPMGGACETKSAKNRGTRRSWDIPLNWPKSNIRLSRPKTRRCTRTFHGHLPYFCRVTCLLITHMIPVYYQYHIDYSTAPAIVRVALCYCIQQYTHTSIMVCTPTPHSTSRYDTATALRCSSTSRAIIDWQKIFSRDVRGICCMTRAE